MQALRSRVAASTIFALLCQIVLLSTPLAGSWAALQSGRAAAECTCLDSDHENAMCPMHHPPAASQTSGTGESECRLTQAANSRLSFIATAGVLPEPPLHLAMPALDGRSFVPGASQLQTRATSLDPPPPRF